MKKVNNLTLRRFLALTGAVAAIWSSGCNQSPIELAGGSDTEICGRVVDSEGNKVPNAKVILLNSTFNPAFDVSASIIDTTDTNGLFTFENITEGEYDLQTLHSKDGTALFLNNIEIAGEQKKDLGDQKLKKTATLIVPLRTDLVKTSGYVFIPGTILSKFAVAGANEVRFDTIAQGIYSSILFQAGVSSSPVTLFSNVIVDSSVTVYLDTYKSWTNLSIVSLNTTSSGADINDTLLNFPVLIRLTSANMDFTSARRNGEDLRFYKNNYRPLAFEIERWDSVNACAEVWVRADTIFGNDSTQSFIMSYGNRWAGSLSKSGNVFDTSEGYLGVWHLGESGGTTVIDATHNKYNGTPFNMDGSSDVEGVIGRAAKFDGLSNYISINNSQSGKLDLSNDTCYAISAWVYENEPDNNANVIISKGSTLYGLEFNEFQKWEFHSSSVNGVVTKTSAAASVGKWTCITGVKQRGYFYLYIDGVLADSMIVTDNPAPDSTYGKYALTIGKQADADTEWLKGLIDEVRILNRNCSAGYIKLSYQNQKSDQNFVVIKKIR
jgi:hypothetical protein